MIQNQQILETIFDAIDEVNPQLEPEKIIEKSADAPLFGKSCQLDSMGLVALCVSVEEKVEERFGIIITIADERAMSQTKSPFLTIHALAGYVSLLIEETEKHPTN